MYCLHRSPVSLSGLNQDPLRLINVLIIQTNKQYLVLFCQSSDVLKHFLMLKLITNQSQDRPKAHKEHLSFCKQTEANIAVSKRRSLLKMMLGPFSSRRSTLGAPF